MGQAGPRPPLRCLIDSAFNARLFRPLRSLLASVVPLLLMSALGCAKRAPPASAPLGPDALVCDPAGWPEALRAPLLESQEAGLQLARRDRYGWMATDRLAEAHGGDPIAAMQALGVSGYIIETSEDTRGVVHFLRAGSELLEVAQVVFEPASPQGRLIALSAPAAPTDSVASAFRAMHSARTDLRFIPKTARYNPDVLPWSADPAEGWAVYLLPGATSLSAVPLGGGYRAHVSPDGSTVLEMLALSQTVLEVPVETIQREKAFFMTTVLTEVPNASYVAFSAIWGIPIAVAATEASFILAGDQLCWARLD